MAYTFLEVMFSICTFFISMGYSMVLRVCIGIILEALAERITQHTRVYHAVTNLQHFATTNIRQEKRY